MLCKIQTERLFKERKENKKKKAYHYIESIMRPNIIVNIAMMQKQPYMYSNDIRILQKIASISS